jgi:hypothetical protein
VHNPISATSEICDTTYDGIEVIRPRHALWREWHILFHSELFSLTALGGDHRVRTLTCAEQYRAMAFAQLTYRESLRDIETCLSVPKAKLYHMGFREPVRRSTLDQWIGTTTISDSHRRPLVFAKCPLERTGSR